ncbi:unnamed protein product [Paramecium pentaurelia]|uniref:Uncharacterized protein n=1 Tax=Paramecium pentaurelia TaxID=43138 RepID=A0A8S1YJC5_9CILI|nr:unnamed protein product [Paramecium pentaurelia]
MIKEGLSYYIQCEKCKQKFHLNKKEIIYLFPHLSVFIKREQQTNANIVENQSKKNNNENVRNVNSYFSFLMNLDKLNAKTVILYIVNVVSNNINYFLKILQMQINQILFYFLFF